MIIYFSIGMILGSLPFILYDKIAHQENNVFMIGYLVAACIVFAACIIEQKIQ